MYNCFGFTFNNIYFFLLLCLKNEKEYFLFTILLYILLIFEQIVLTLLIFYAHIKNTTWIFYIKLVINFAYLFIWRNNY